jgi:hypothetical protein
MANGPLGGNMGTPPVPPQPPQVSFETTAQSRGNFNNFLKSMPNTTAMTPLPPMGSPSMMPAPNPMGNIDIFNEPMGMQFGGVAGNPLSGYGDYLSQQIDNTQVEPFIQEVEQMANDRFNLGGDSGGLKTFLEPTIFEPPQDLSRPKMEFAPMMQRPAAPFQMQGLGQPMRDKDGILREPMGLRGGPELFKTLDQQIFNDGFMPGNTYLTGSRQFQTASPLMGSLPRTYADGGDVPPRNVDIMGQDHMLAYITPEEGSVLKSLGGAGEPGPMGIPSFFDAGEGMGGYGGGDSATDDNNDDDDGFSFNDDVSDYSTDDSGIYTGGDDNNQDIALPTPRPEILQEAIGRAENQVFGDTEGDALGFFNKAGGLTEAGQKEFDSAIMANLDVLQDDKPADTGIQLANVFDNQSILGDSTKGVNPADIVQASFRPGSLNPTFGGNVLDGLDLNTAFGENRTKTDPNVTGSTGAELDAMDRAITNTQRVTDRENQLANVNDQTLADRLQNQRGLDRDISTIPDTALETMIDRRDVFQPDNIGAGQQPVDTSLENMLDRRDRLPDQVFDIPTNVIGRNPDLDALRSDRATYDTIYDIDTTDTRNFVGDDFEPALTLSDRADPSTNMVEAGGMGIPAPKEFRDPFPNAGIGAIPTLTSLANKFSAYSRGRVLDSIAQKGYTPVMDGDVIVGAKNKFGQLMEGMDPNAPMGSDDNNENPFILKPKAKEEEKEEEDKPPNVIGGGVPTPVPEPVPTVVDSPFTSNVGDFIPASFNTGD